MARELLFGRFGNRFVQLHVIIIKEFLARLDVAQRIDEDAVVFLDRFAVWIARMIDPARIVTAEDASHIYEAYTSVRELLNNQKRQMIGQTTVHVLVEYLKGLPPDQRANLATTLRRIEAADPDWAKLLIHQHLRRTRFFWRLFPDVLTFRFKRWRKLPGLKRLTHLPAAAAGWAVTLIACARARWHFKRGQMHYWPKAGRENIQRLAVGESGAPRPQTAKG